MGLNLKRDPQAPGIEDKKGKLNFNRIRRTSQIKHLCLPKTVYRFFLDSNVLGYFLKKRDMTFDGSDYMAILMMVIIQPGSEEIRI